MKRYIYLTLTVVFIFACGADEVIGNGNPQDSDLYPLYEGSVPTCVDSSVGGYPFNEFYGGLFGHYFPTFNSALANSDYLSLDR